MNRTILFSLLIAGCSVGDHLVDANEANIGTAARFASGATVIDPGFGVLPQASLEVTQIPRLWASMGDRLCVVEGRNGQIEQDVFIDDPTVVAGVVAVDVDERGFVVVTGGQVVITDGLGAPVETIEPAGQVAGGKRLADGSVVLLVDTEAGCLLQHEEVRVPLSDGACRVGADLERSAEALLISTDSGVYTYRDGVVERTADGDQVTVDSVVGSVFTGSTGSSMLQGRIGNSTISIDLQDAVVDFAARAGHLVVLTEKPELVRIDSATGEELDRQAYAGAMDRERLQLGEDGYSVVLTGAGRVQFYRVRTDAQTGL